MHATPPAQASQPCTLIARMRDSGLSTVHSYSQECTIGRRESNIPVITELALHSVTTKNRYGKNCVEIVANEDQKSI